jgi:hypothetical protein
MTAVTTKTRTAVVVLAGDRAYEAAVGHDADVPDAHAVDTAVGSALTGAAHPTPSEEER